MAEAAEDAAAVLTSCKEFVAFRSSVPKRSYSVGHGAHEHVFTLYDCGPKEIRCPLVMMPPACSGAEAFFMQMVSLSAAGIRVIALNYPVVDDVDELCGALVQLLDMLLLDQVHIFGASLGGFLAQKLAQHTYLSQRVRSLILCNSFNDSSAFTDLPRPSTYKFMPAFMLRRMIMANFTAEQVESKIADSIDFMVDRLEQLTRGELVSRLTLHSKPAYVEPQKITGQNIKIMLLDVMDDSALGAAVREEMGKCYPEAKAATLKTGGNFPYLSRAEEVNMYIRVHLRQFDKTRYAASDSFDNSEGLDS